METRGGTPSRLHPLGAVVWGLPGVTEEQQQQRFRGQAELPWGSWLERRGLSTAWVWSGALPGGGGEPGLEAAGGKSVSQWAVGRRGRPGQLRVGPPRSPGLSPQSSQPSTTSPFKQEVFVYSPSPSSESPSLGAATTPIIMSRSPTGRCAPRGQGRGCALSTVCGAPAPGVRNWPVLVQPQCEALSSAPSLRLLISLQGLFLSSHYSREQSSERSWDCVSRKPRFFPRTSRSSPSQTQPPITAMVLPMQGYQVGRAFQVEGTAHERTSGN